MKKAASLLFCLALSGLFCTTAFAQAGDTGTSGVLTYTVNEDGTSCTITGCDSTFTGEVVIPSEIDGYPVRKIGESAFKGCSLTGVTIPDSVRTMGMWVFSGCENLKSAGPIGSGSDIEFGWTEEIPENAFMDCKSLTHVTIPASVTRMGVLVFEKCENLKSAGPIGSGSDIEFGWTEAIPDRAFYSAELTDFTFPDGVTSIGSNAFSVCPFTSMTIPDTVTSIGGYAFSYSPVTSITIPASVDTVGVGVFSNCNQLTSAGPIGSGCDIEFGWTEAIPDNAFWYAELTDVIIPDSVKSIGIGSFSGCALTSVTLPDGVTSLGVSSFSGCPLTSVTLPNSVISIGPSAFSGCPLTNITLPNGVTSIGGSAFENCKLTSVIIPESVTSIGAYAFRDCPLTSVTLPASVTSMGGSVFNGCDNLRSAGPIGSGNDIEFGWTETIPMSAFADCKSLTYVTIPTSITQMEGFAFAGCDNLKSAGPFGSGCNIEFGWAETIPDYAFASAELIDITFPDGVTSIGSLAFSNCPLTSVTIPDSVTSIGDYAFSGCSLTSITIPDGVTSIGDYAFARCPLTSITIPESVTSIGGGAFDSCTQLTDVYYAGSESKWKSISIAWNNGPLTSATIHYGKEDPELLGDVSNDNKLSTQDVVLLSRSVLAPGMSGVSQAVADMNTDGKINSQDVVLLCRAVLTIS